MMFRRAFQFSKGGALRYHTAKITGEGA